MLEDEEMDADHDQEEEEEDEEEDKDEEKDREDELHDVEEACQIGNINRDTRMVEATGNHDNSSQKASDQNSRKRRYKP